MCVEHRELAVADEGRSPRETVEEHAAEGVDVRPSIEGTALDLFRRRVVDGAEEETGLRHPLRARTPRESEVGEVRVISGLGDEDVGRLDIAMHEARRVRGIEGAADLVGDPQRVFEGERSPVPNQRLQARSANVAHGDEQHAVDLIGVVDRYDVGMVERRG